MGGRIAKHAEYAFQQISKPALLIHYVIITLAIKIVPPLHTRPRWAKTRMGSTYEWRNFGAHVTLCDPRYASSVRFVPAEHRPDDTGRLVGHRQVLSYMTAPIDR